MSAHRSALALVLTRVRVAAFAIGLGVFAVLAPPALAASSEQRLSSANASIGNYAPSLASNARGDVAVTWGERTGYFLAVRRAGAARFGRPIAFSSTYASPSVAMLSDGTALVASSRYDATMGGERSCCPVVFGQTLARGSRHLSRARLLTIRD